MENNIVLDLMTLNRVNKYIKNTAEVLVEKYGMDEATAYKAIKWSFLYDSLIRFPEETLHDDIATMADFVYEDYTAEHLLQM